MVFKKFHKIQCFKDFFEGITVFTDAMLVSVKKHYTALKRELVDDASYELILTEGEQKDLNELIQFLHIFDGYTKTIQTCKYPSLSMAVFMREELYLLLTEKPEKDSPLTKQLKKAMLLKWDDRLPSLGIHYMAALLDPTLKSLKSLKDYLKNRLDSDPAQFALDIIEDLGVDKKKLLPAGTPELTELPQHHSVTVAAKRRKEQIEVLRRVSVPGTVQAISGTKTTLKDYLKDELVRFQCLNLREEELFDFDLLKFWERHCKAYPVLQYLQNSLELFTVYQPAAQK